MLINRLHILAAALTGCAIAASAYVMRTRSRRQETKRLKDDLSTWEGEGGKPASSDDRPAESA